MKRFSVCGDIKDIRLVKDRDGRFKKIAFIEFDTEQGLSSALKLDKAYLTPKLPGGANGEGGVKTSVAMRVTQSKPPTKAERKQQLSARKRPEDQ